LKAKALNMQPTDSKPATSFTPGSVSIPKHIVQQRVRAPKKNIPQTSVERNHFLQVVRNYVAEFNPVPPLPTNDLKLHADRRTLALVHSLSGVSLDGKTLCNTLAAHERNVHLLSLFDQAVGGVLGQQAVDPTTNEAKAALEILKAIVLEGRLVTGDAMFCQRDLCRQIVDDHGDYLLVVKDNQPELKAAIEAEFQPGFSPRYREAATAIAL